MKINLERHETCSRSVIHHSEKCVVLTFLAMFPHCRREQIECWLLKCRARNVEGTVFTAKCKSKANSSWAALQPQVVTRQWCIEFTLISPNSQLLYLFLLASYCEWLGPPWSQHFFAKAGAVLIISRETFLYSYMFNVYIMQACWAQPEKCYAKHF